MEDKQGLETTGATVNEDRFTKCINACECLHDDILLHQIGVLCDGPAVDPILEGTWEPPDHVNKYTKLILEHMEHPEKIKADKMGTPHIS